MLRAEQSEQRCTTCGKDKPRCRLKTIFFKWVLANDLGKSAPRMMKMSVSLLAAFPHFIWEIPCGEWRV